MESGDENISSPHPFVRVKRRRDGISTELIRPESSDVGGRRGELLDGWGLFESREARLKRS